MARIRSIKPDFWADEKLATVSRDARLLFIGLISMADDEGRMRGNPAFVRSSIFPYDDDLDIRVLLAELSAKALVHLYVDSGQAFLHVRNFARHQRIDKPSKSVLPAPPRYVPPEAFGEHSRNGRRPLGDGSPTDGMGVDGSGVDTEGSGLKALSPDAVPAPPTAAVQPSLLPDAPKPPKRPKAPKPAPPVALPTTPLGAFLAQQWPDIENPEQVAAAWTDMVDNPQADLLAEVRRAHAWLVEHPDKGLRRPSQFLGTWLRKNGSGAAWSGCKQSTSAHREPSGALPVPAFLFTKEPVLTPEQQAAEEQRRRAFAASLRAADAAARAAAEVQP